MTAYAVVLHLEEIYILLGIQARFIAGSFQIEPMQKQMTRYSLNTRTLHDCL